MRARLRTGEWVTIVRWQGNPNGTCCEDSVWYHTIDGKSYTGLELSFDMKGTDRYKTGVGLMNLLDSSSKNDGHLSTDDMLIHIDKALEYATNITKELNEFLKRSKIKELDNGTDNKENM